MKLRDFPFLRCILRIHQGVKIEGWIGQHLSAWSPNQVFVILGASEREVMQTGASIREDLLLEQGYHPNLHITTVAPRDQACPIKVDLNLDPEVDPKRPGVVLFFTTS